MAHFISQTVVAAIGGYGERGGTEQVSWVEEMLYTKGMLPHGLLLFAAAVVAVVAFAATEPALCIVAISAAGAFFYVIANGRHWGGGGRVAPCCMPLRNVQQLKRVSLYRFLSRSQITQHLESCRKSRGNLQLQLSAACGSLTQ